MRRSDLIAQERAIAASYRREAAVRRKANPSLAGRLEEWAAASDRRAEEIEFGPLFRDPGASREGVEWSEPKQAEQRKLETA